MRCWECGAGEIARDAGFADGDGNADNDCEVNTANDAENCGRCTHACTGGYICDRSACVNSCTQNGALGGGNALPVLFDRYRPRIKFQIHRDVRHRDDLLLRNGARVDLSH